MKTTRFITFCIFLLQYLFSFAQSNLSDSPRSSSQVHIYKISQDDLRKIHLKGGDFHEDMLKTLVLKYNAGEGIPSLPKGNYVFVKVIDNQLNYTEHTVDNLYAKIVPSEKFVVCLYDSLGNIINDAEVRKGSSKLKYDRNTQTYSTNKAKDEDIIEIVHNGVFHYLEIEDGRYSNNYHFFKSTWSKAKSRWVKLKRGIKYIFNPSKRPAKKKYTGFIVFNKPKYKPGETVKLKGYLSEYNGKRYNKPVGIRLFENHYMSNVDTILTKLEPYRPGMYSYEFKLTDDLDLMLDKRYSISLITDDKKTNAVREYFRYEDYELKGITFSLKSNKKKYDSGDSIKLDMKVTDESDMAVYGGKVEVLVTPEHFDRNKMKIMEPVFIPDTLWSHTVDLLGASEKDLIIPDSIFPPNIDLKFKVRCTYLSADNEKHVETLSLEKLNKKYTLDFSLDKGMLTIKELYQGKSQRTLAKITVSGENDEYLYQDSVMLPHTFAIPWNAGDVTAVTRNTKDFYFSDATAKQQQLGYKFYRNNDSIYLKVDNPANIPFWYTIRKMKKEIARGYTTQLNYVIKDTGEDGYSMQLSYLFGRKGKSIEGLLPFARKNMTLDVTTPTTVYPGQKANVQISVTDKKGKPVKDADITAWSFTSKFKNYSMPNLPIGGKARYAKQFYNTRYEMDDDSYYNSKSSLTWKRWASAIALDTVEYYKFLYPETYYVHQEPSSNGKTQLSPFVVIDGEVQGVHLLWIDERLYYTNQSQHQDIYTFEIDPGKHSLRFRTYNREILAMNFYLEEGKKYILSFNAGKPYIKIPYENPEWVPFVLTSRLLDKEEQGYLSDKEVSELSSQLIIVDNHFGETELPNVHQKIEIPGYIDAGNTLYYLNDTTRTTYDRTLMTQVKTPILAGPFPKRNMFGGLSNIASVYAGNRLLANVEIDGGNQYTLFPNYQKIKQWDKSPINRNISAFKPLLNFKQQLLTKVDIENRIEARIVDAMRSARGFVNIRQYNRSFRDTNYNLELVLGKDTSGVPIKPTFIFIEPKREEERKDFQLYYGGTRNFNNLLTEELTLHLIFKDSTLYSYPIQLHKGGKNYLKLDSIAGYKKDSEISRVAYNLFNKGIKTRSVENPYISKPIRDTLSLSPLFDNETFSKENKNKRVMSGIVRDNEDVVIGATVRIKGSNKGAFTGFDGRFEIEVDGNATLEVMYIGYKTKEVKVSTGHDYTITLQADEQRLEEVVVIGYGVQKKVDLTGTVVTINPLDGYFDNQVLQGRVAGLKIRGTSSVNTEAKPLIIINGLPFEGTLEDIDASSILSLNVLKDAAATSMYGARAANGVIMIETSALSSSKIAESENISNEESGNTIRRNFHDDAFWQPKLKTDEKGEVNFEVTYPDDITSWNAYFVALGGKRQTDIKQMTVKSFKALSTRLSTPRFAIRGDSLNAIGKVTNYFGDSLTLTRTIDLDTNKRVDKMRIGNSHVDYIPVNAMNGDSLTLAYSLQMENGYFDGEERSFPVFEQGLLQTYGDFKVINDSSTYTLKTDPGLGEVTLYAEASSLDLFLREIETIDRYPYLCNEQMASKIKALLAKKYICRIQGKEFKEDKKMNGLIRDLNKNKNNEGLWGWWNKSESVMWISKHVIHALLDADEAGYQTGLDKHRLALAFEQELKNSLSKLSLVVNKGKSSLYAKRELLDRLIFLKRLNAAVDYKAYLYQLDAQLENSTVGDNLKTMLVMSSTGLQDSIRMDSLMHYSDKTILGSLYWGERRNSKLQPRYFYRPNETNIENTLVAYQILKNIGGHEKELESIRTYFFEQRQNNTWSNIYESSRIIQTIMPDMLKKAGRYDNVVMNMNGTQISEFPYTAQLDSKQKIQVRKTGTMPLFITAYQREWNKNPVKEKSKGFEISTMFKINNDSVASLKEGKTTILQATLNLAGDAEYVQIEIPIPAGCSYESKSMGNYWEEAHREHYKEKVVIFCNKLSKGQHVFNVELLPRYTGRYTLNPAKAELMYFPSFYGNEEIKTTLIKHEYR